MGFMQVYRVGPTAGEAALGKISRLLTGEGIDSDDLGDQRPDTGCVLIDLNTGEENVKKVQASVPQLPHILVTSTELLGSKQLGLADEIVSPDMPDQEIVRRVECMQNMAIRLVEEVPEPTQTRVLLDGDTEGDEAPLKELADTLSDAEIEWEALKEDKDPEGTGIVYTLYRRLSYARMLQSDYPGYIHIQMAGTSELRVEALTAGDVSYTPKVTAEEIVTRHGRYIEMLDRLRDPDRFREVSSEESAMSVLFVGDRNVGTTLKGRMSEAIQMTTAASTAGQMAAAKQHDAVLVQLGSKEDAKERFTFLQVLLKAPDPPNWHCFSSSRHPTKSGPSARRAASQSSNPRVPMLWRRPCRVSRQLSYYNVTRGPSREPTRPVAFPRQVILWSGLQGRLSPLPLTPLLPGDIFPPEIYPLWLKSTRCAPYGPIAPGIGLLRRHRSWVVSTRQMPVFTHHPDWVFDNGCRRCLTTFLHGLRATLYSLLTPLMSIRHGTRLLPNELPSRRRGRSVMRTYHWHGISIDLHTH